VFVIGDAEHITVKYHKTLNLIFLSGDMKHWEYDIVNENNKLSLIQNLLNLYTFHLCIWLSRRKSIVTSSHPELLNITVSASSQTHPELLNITVSASSQTHPELLNITVSASSQTHPELLNITVSASFIMIMYVSAINFQYV
jgi:hypothetical protein